MKQRTRIMPSGDDLINYNILNNKKDDTDGTSDIMLHRIRAQDHFIEAQVQEGDTLQALALRFRCSISELKRINQIHKDNEIYARRTIKVPVTPYSVLTEMIPTHLPELQSSSSNNVPTNHILKELLENNHTSSLSQQKNSQIENVSPRENGDHTIDCNSIVLNSTLAPSVATYTDMEGNETVSEDTQLLPNKQKEPVEAVVVKELTSHGADFGLKWFHLVGFMLILGVVVPLVYIMFYLDKHEHTEESFHSNR
ncbi:lysM and putative peptidoglycan-binding domain-containing protein 3 [Achroia grisella]|uniref:lysM and putative peptidoglycan-binding domain-containing protein 3 n=1 Tax=Achroia grisella TaxID=688607 RepID=UPI0027D2340B|nr:lysM and putative peptidoglycan-binding domain-containing protein 3 [Achroia grisella]XP_059054921.1 lysM and putative peptidoglycan-binding domain-containing protein 3 [Achroia grisella]